MISFRRNCVTKAIFPPQTVFFRQAPERQPFFEPHYYPQQEIAMRKSIVTLITTAIGIDLYAQEGIEPTGTGSSGDPYQISTWQNLYWITQSTGRWDDYYIQTADIDLGSAIPAIETWDNNKGWTPIGSGTGSNSFSGSYDGQGHIINGLYINRSTEWSGLFGLMQGASISNLGVINVNITGAYGTGGLAGDNYNSSTISNCYTTGSISGTTYVGGLVGINQSASVSNCYSTCTVSGSNTNIGGLVGDNNGSTLTGSYATGAVSGVNTVGGLIGFNRNTTTVSNNYSRGNVTRSSGTGTEIGSFCGNNSYATINYCYSTGSVSYTGYSNPTDKGFVGYTNSGSYTANFFDNQVSGQTTGTGATGKTTTQMQTQGTYSGWDFTSTWAINSALNGGYSYLQWAVGVDQSLPVELTSLSAISRSGGVVLSWRTESETENLGFIIGRRNTENGEWEEIASYLSCEALAGHGSTSEAHDYAYTDAAVVPGATYLYRLADVDYSGKVTYHKEVEVKVEVEKAQTPVVFGLQPAYPNPFNPSLTIPYGLTEDGNMSLKVYNLRGELVEVLLSTYALKGTYSMKWSPQNLSAGIYLVRLESGKRTNLQKVVFVK
jgi:hypothetical protein